MLRIDYYKAVGVDCRLSMAQFTVSIFLQEATRAINDYLLRQWIRFLTTSQEIDCRPFAHVAHS